MFTFLKCKELLDELSEYRPYTKHFAPSRVVQAISVPTCSPEVTDLNLGRNTEHPVLGRSVSASERIPS
jgi:hypothetical protein